MSPQTRQQVRQRAGARCEYCRLPDWIEWCGPFHIEHVVARQHGGGDDFANLAWACSRGNRQKGPNLTAVDPDSAEVVPLFNPRRDGWSDHFTVEGARVLGLTPAGRATVWLLQMNSDRRLELRARLTAEALW